MDTSIEGKNWLNSWRGTIQKKRELSAKYSFYNFRVSSPRRQKIEEGMIETKLSSGILSDW